MNAAIDLLDLGGKRRTPYIAQSEGSECALACIAMVSGYHGYQTDLIALRQRYGMSLKGANLKQVIQVAEDIGFNARPLRGEVEDLPHLSLPAILHWNLNHFVVLTKISTGLRGTRYHIHDPARGTLILTRDEVSRQFTGVALDLLKSESFKPKIERRQLGITQLWSSMSGFWQTIRQVVLLSLVLQFVVLVSPFFLQISIDTVFPSFDRDLLLMLALGFSGLTIINFLASWLRSLVLVTLSNSLSYQVIVNLFRHLVRLPLDWFEKRHVGDIISRFGSTQPISQLLSQGMIAAFIDGVMALLTLTLMFVYSGILGGVAVAALAIYAVIRLAFLQALRLKNLDAITTAARENSSFIETVRGIAAIKAFGQEGNRQRLWQKTKADAINAQIKLGRLTAGFDALGGLVLALEKVLFVYIAIRLALDAKLSVGMIFAFQAYKDQFLGAGMRLVEQAINFKIIQVHLTRISDIALSKIEDDGRQRSNETPDYSQGIELRNIRYRYGVGELEVLKGVSLKIEPGEMVAFIGPSGGGKTTLMKIMMGLFDPSYGEVLVGGRQLSSFDKRRARQVIGSVAQDDELFAGSLAENIAFFDPEADMARVEEAAAQACILNDIDKMPMRFDTMVGDMGSVLSGGQKQRVLLARALYHKPQILFIDEGTAHLDPQTEESVLQALAKLGITIVVVAHRSKSIERANRVVAVMSGLAIDAAPQLSLPTEGRK
ncbi:MAG: peptidase domain-containing ABC transporter [Proteobacteria bacterium]|nr:peptidase domain-containing ABC transporter [Pseudomonadota bacterium]